MKRLPIILFVIVMACASLTSCLNSSDTWSEYRDWRNDNLSWLANQTTLKNADGTSFYNIEMSSWDSAAYVLMHWFNDTSLTAQNLKPLYSSTVDVKYKGWLYDGTAFDSSYLRTTPGDSLFRATLNSGIIQGWALAITRMHIGDSCRVVIPYNIAYGESETGDIKPYSCLTFDIKLVGIPYYETNSNR